MGGSFVHFPLEKRRILFNLKESYYQKTYKYFRPQRMVHVRMFADQRLSEEIESNLYHTTSVDRDSELKGKCV